MATVGATLPCHRWHNPSLPHNAIDGKPVHPTFAIDGTLNALRRLACARGVPGVAVRARSPWGRWGRGGASRAVAPARRRALLARPNARGRATRAPASPGLQGKTTKTGSAVSVRADARASGSAISVSADAHASGPEVPVKADARASLVRSPGRRRANGAVSRRAKSPLASWSAAPIGSALCPVAPIAVWRCVPLRQMTSGGRAPGESGTRPARSVSRCSPASPHRQAAQVTRLGPTGGRAPS
jgi:hypothetical protein